MSKIHGADSGDESDESDDESGEEAHESGDESEEFDESGGEHCSSLFTCFSFSAPQPPYPACGALWIYIHAYVAIRRQLVSLKNVFSRL